MSQRSQGRDRDWDARAGTMLLGILMMLAMVVVVAVQGQKTRLVAEPIWLLEDRLGSYNALVNSGL